ncbi:MAG: HAMP domain-containing histidine kinase [Lawsonibacter sp.]|nr:HAMP domain-containing histidine kinase [Lawsonibacter sp.]
MKKLQGNTAAKVCAWIVLLAAAWGAGVFGVRALLSFQSVPSDSWQYSGWFYSAMAERSRDLKEGIELSCQLDALEQRLAEGNADATLQADAEALREERENVGERFSRNNTWFRFRVLNADTGEVMGTNLAEGESMRKAVRDMRRETFAVQDGEVYEDVFYYDPETGAGYQTPPTAGLNPEAESAPVKLVLEYGVPEEIANVEIQDEFYQIWQTYEHDRAFFRQYLTGFGWLGALTLLALIWVLWTSGHKAGEERIVTTWQEKIWFDLYAAAMIAAVVCLTACIIWAAEQLYWGSANVYSRMNEDHQTFFDLGVLGTGALFAAAVGCAALLLRTLAVRIKAGRLAQTTLLCRVVGWTVRTVRDFVRFLPFTWKLVAGFGVYVIFTFWLTMRGRYDGFFLMINFLLQLALLLFLSWWAYGYYRLRQGTKSIAGGDLEYQIDTKRMPYDLRLQAEDLNNISAGLSAAVDEKLKSERFKAELITNVSHDLKTPLTSIINYVNLLKSTEQTDPKASEYIEVLDRKSQRLKKLTEDLVEASKASTGVLSVTREKIGMGQLIDQASAEWEEKLTGRKLTLVTTLPEGETWVYADGRHLWRVLDNLLSNCAKYAMEGTRVYLDLERGKGQVVLSVKNISRDPLNVPAERLMERFVRGEDSRSTEGSGLGLSIARSLTELQGGAFDLAVDGDLFKAIVTLPQAS